MTLIDGDSIRLERLVFYDFMVSCLDRKSPELQYFSGGEFDFMLVLTLFFC